MFWLLERLGRRRRGCHVRGVLALGGAGEGEERVSCERCSGSWRGWGGGGEGVILEVFWLLEGLGRRRGCHVRGVLTLGGAGEEEERMSC